MICHHCKKTIPDHMAQSSHIAADTRPNARIAGRIYDQFHLTIHTKAEREKIGKKILDHPENKKMACSLTCNSAAMRGCKGQVLEDHFIYLISIMGEL